MATLSQIALTFIPKLGPTAIRRLEEVYPGEDLFALPKSELRAAFGKHADIAECIASKSSHARAEEELAFCERSGIRPLWFTDADYPQRLNRPECSDSPVLLYAMGTADLNAERTVSVVGTRRATALGRDNTDRLVRDLKKYNTPIISGLAYGIDTAAHTAALDHGLPTVAVLGHGLDRIYPAENRPLAKRILAAGGTLLTEYPSGTAIHPTHFPARNRIIAALGDATVVVEASAKGGALITAAIAASYDRDVFALPGRLGDTYSRGCLNLIATQRALLLRTADDIAFHLGWPLAGQQMSIAEVDNSPTLSPMERRTLDLLHENDRMTLDEVAARLATSLPKAAALMFNLEMQGLVHTLPGHLYQASRQR